ncbi:hypothetical protein CHS0354_033212 [Potamilus streckersoni]|uniref:Methyltransferase-like protein 23 n=1 Tax=Potamilus streckersoni TaxID=2493646 RepID=A0AAE0S6A5_9BIVA|nr:hypothetical protein CHS0354_033212 [Potamilus streckersoni]
MRKFIFRDQTTHEKLSVTVPEVLDGSYGMHVWPCAPVLAQYIWYNRNVLKGKYVLEIGAGTALPGVMAGLCGANIILSDSASLPKCLENCQQTCEANGLQNIPILGITWGCFDPHLLRLGKVDVILGSDCFYDTKDFEDVIMTVSFILERNKNAEFWSTYQERSSERSIEHLLLKWNLHCRQIPLSSFDADNPNLAESDLPGNHTIHMLIISKRRDKIRR